MEVCHPLSAFEAKSGSLTVDLPLYLYITYGPFLSTFTTVFINRLFKVGRWD